MILVACGAAYAYIRRNENKQPTLTDMSDYTRLPVGYRQNNPLNIRVNSHNNWKGKITPPDDPRFEQFQTMEYGYRAALVLLRNYISDGDNTIERIINRWAPSTENNVPAYINDVCSILQRMTGKEITPFDAIARNDRAMLSKLVYAMSIHENGYKDLDKRDILSTYGLPNMEIINEAWKIL